MLRLAAACALVMVVASGCKTKLDAPSGPATSPRDAASTSTPPTPPTAADARARATQLLDTQVTALKRTEPDDATLAATFTDDAVVLVPDPRLAHAQIGLRAAIARLAPSATLQSVSVDKLAVGGTADALWLTAELTFVQDHATAIVRATELATATSGWKVVAAAFSEVSTPSAMKNAPTTLDGATTDRGALTELLGDGPKLAAALAPDAIVISPTARAQGAEAKALVTGWPPLTLAAQTREVRGPTWGFSLGRVSQTVTGEKYPLRMSGLVIGVPGAGGAWSVVAAHYTGN